MHGPGQLRRLLAHGLTCPGIEQRRGRLLDDLLIAPLDRTFALAQMDDIAVLVAQHLDFDVAWMVDVFLDEEPIIAERGCRLGTGTRKALSELTGGAGNSHAFAAAAGRSLDHHGKTDAGCNQLSLGRRSNNADMTRHDGHTRGGCELLRFDLVAHAPNGAWIRADEHDACSGN